MQASVLAAYIRPINRSRSLKLKFYFIQGIVGLTDD